MAGSRHREHERELLPRGKWLLAALMLLAVIWAAQAVVGYVQDFRAQYLGGGLRR